MQKGWKVAMKKSVLKLFVTTIAMAIVFSFSGIGVFADETAPASPKTKSGVVRSGGIEDYELPTAETNADNGTTLANGVYDIPEKDFTFEGGTGKAKYFCTKVIVKDGKAYGEFTTNSKSMTHVFLGEKKGESGLDSDNLDLFNPETNATGKDVYPLKDKKVIIPVKLNGKTPFAGRTTAMSDPHWIQYWYTIKLDEPEVNPEEIILTPTNKINMFRLVSAKVVTEKGESYLVFALSGRGYEYIIKDDVKSAEKKGDHPENWAKFTINENDKYEFKIPFDKKETKIPLVAVSQKYYDMFKAGKVEFSRCLYARQVVVDLEKKTIVSDNYHNFVDLKVDNKAKDLSVKSAVIEEVGSPFANDFERNLTLNVKNDSIDKLFLGTAVEAEKAEEKDVIKLVENKFILNKLENVETRFPVAFHNKKDGKWYDRFMTVADNTLKIRKTDEVQDLEKEIEDLRNKLSAEKARHMTVRGLKVKAAKSHKFTLTWKKTLGASGYIIQVKKPGSKKYVTLKTLSGSKYVTPKYKKNKKYGFRIRTYKKIGGKKVYGVWKAYKTLKCK